MWDHHQENTERWCAWQRSKEKAIILQKEQCYPSTVCEKKHTNKPEVYWTNVLWMDEIKMRSFWLEWKVLHLTKCKHKNLIPSIKHVLGLLCHLCTRMACRHWWNYEFWILPQNSTGKHQGSSLWTEPQEKMGHAARNNWTTQIMETKWLKQKKINILDCLS